MRDDLHLLVAPLCICAIGLLAMSFGHAEVRGAAMVCAGLALG